MISALFGIASAIAALAAVARLSTTEEWAIEPYAGVFRMDESERDERSSRHFDDQEASAAFGVRALVLVADRWEIGAEYGYTSFQSTMRFSDETSDSFERSEVEAQSFVALVRRSWPFVFADVTATAGGGALRMEAGEFESGGSTMELALADVAPPDPEREIEPLVTLGLGARRHLVDRFAVMAELRDLMHSCDGEADSFRDASDMFCDTGTWLHHLQLTAAFRIAF